MQNRILSFKSFEIKSAAGLDPLPIQIREPINPERVFRFRASDDTVDRYGDVILASGWRLSDYVKNPVIMAFHDYSRWPIGVADAVGIVDNALMIDCEFDPPDVDEAADLVFRKIKQGTVKSGSVGFSWSQCIMANEKGAEQYFKNYPQARRIFLEQDLIEFTICPLPANPNALAASVGFSNGNGVEIQRQADAPRFCEQAVMDRLARIEKSLKTGEQNG